MDGHRQLQQRPHLLVQQGVSGHQASHQATRVQPHLPAPPRMTAVGNFGTQSSKRSSKRSVSRDAAGVATACSQASTVLTTLDNTQSQQVHRPDETCYAQSWPAMHMTHDIQCIACCQTTQSCKPALPPATCRLRLWVQVRAQVLMVNRRAPAGSGTSCFKMHNRQYSDCTPALLPAPQHTQEAHL
jgi:hypothetical protein